MHIGVSSVPSYLLPELLAAYHERPRKSVPHQLLGQSGCDKQGRRQHLRYRSGRHKDRGDQLRILPVASDELVIATPNTPHFRAYQSQPDRWEALLRRTVPAARGQLGHQAETLYFLQNHGLSLDELNVIAVMDDAAALKRCIALGMGISILSRATVQTDAQQGRLLLSPSDGQRSCAGCTLYIRPYDVCRAGYSLSGFL